MHVGTDLVTLSLSIKYSSIVVETMKSVIDPDIDVIIDSEYRQFPGQALAAYCLSRLMADTARTIKYLSCHGARQLIYYFVKNLKVA